MLHCSFGWVFYNSVNDHLVLSVIVHILQKIEVYSKAEPATAALVQVLDSHSTFTIWYLLFYALLYQTFACLFNDLLILLFATLLHFNIVL